MPELRQKEIMGKMNELRNQHSLNDELSAEIYKQTQRADQCDLENEQLREEICRLRSKTENLNREKAFIADSCEQTVMEIRSKLESVRQELINTEHQFEEERLIRFVLNFI
jgi:replicative DNA helicase